MASDHIRYDLLTQQALRGMVRTVLADIAKNGLPGAHHFYISFDTHADGVRLSPQLLERHPEEMTIVLQHQFWDLTVSNDRFEVGLSFDGISERLSVPFEAINEFYDPSVQFGVQFEEVTEGQEDAAAKEKAGDKKRRAPAENRPAANAVGEPATPPASDDNGKPSPGAEVVRLDRFRKK